MTKNKLENNQNEHNSFLDKLFSGFKKEQTYMKFNFSNKVLSEEEEKRIKNIFSHLVQQEDYDSM